MGFQGLGDASAGEAVGEQSVGGFAEARAEWGIPEEASDRRRQRLGVASGDEDRVLAVV